MIRLCRLFGISYGDQKESVSTAVIAANLFANLTKGGPHSFGWFVSDGDSVWWQKHHGRADSSAAFDTVMAYNADDDGPAEDDVKFFVGHTRYATAGSPEKMVNNHPIEHGNIVGVHNGKVHNAKEVLDVTGREDKRAEVDSEAIFAAVNRWGNVKGLQRLRTEAVAVYVDMRNPRRFFLARSDFRYVTIGYTDKGNLIFASEKAALDALWPMVRFTKFTTVKTNRLLTIANGKITERRDIAFKSVENDRVGVRPAKAKAPAHSSLSGALPPFEFVPSGDGSMGELARLMDAQDRIADRRADRLAAKAIKRGQYFHSDQS